MSNPVRGLLERIETEGYDVGEGAATGRTATASIVELIANDMVEAPKVLRRLRKLVNVGQKFDDDQVVQDLITALKPVITHWLDQQGVRATGSTKATTAVRAFAREK